MREMFCKVQAVQRGVISRCNAESFFFHFLTAEGLLTQEVAALLSQHVRQLQLILGHLVNLGHGELTDNIGCYSLCCPQFLKKMSL